MTTPQYYQFNKTTLACEGYANKTDKPKPGNIVSTIPQVMEIEATRNSSAHQQVSQAQYDKAFLQRDIGEHDHTSFIIRERVNFRFAWCYFMYSDKCMKRLVDTVDYLSNKD